MSDFGDFWRFVDETAEDVRRWPQWMRAGLHPNPLWRFDPSSRPVYFPLQGEPMAVPVGQNQTLNDASNVFSARNNYESKLTALSTAQATLATAQANLDAAAAALNAAIGALKSDADSYAP